MSYHPFTFIPVNCGDSDDHYFPNIIQEAGNLHMILTLTHIYTGWKDGLGRGPSKTTISFHQESKLDAIKDKSATFSKSSNRLSFRKEWIGHDFWPPKKKKNSPTHLMYSNLFKEISGAQEYAIIFLQEWNHSVYNVQNPGICCWCGTQKFTWSNVWI